MKAETSERIGRRGGRKSSGEAESRARSASATGQAAPSMLAMLMKGYNWFDIALQQSAEHFGVPRLSRQQAMLMTNLIYSSGRPTELARALGVSRQAIHYTIRELQDLDIIEVVKDPTDARSRIVRMSANGERLAAKARAIVAELEKELASRIGARSERALRAALAEDWGSPPIVRRLPQAHTG